MCGQSNGYKLVTVPATWEVTPLLSSACKEGCNIEIASNYSFLKISAAIIQILYGSYELYAAAVRSVQLERFGYAAYSLTVIPYTLMSFLNGLASLSRPAYPARYLIYYNGYHRKDCPKNICWKARLDQTKGQGDVLGSPSETTTEDQGDVLGSPSVTSTEGQGEVLGSPSATATETRCLCSENSQIEVDRGDTLDPDQILLIRQAHRTVVGAVGNTYGVPKHVPPSVRIPPIQGTSRHVGFSPLSVTHLTSERARRTDSNRSFHHSIHYDSYRCSVRDYLPTYRVRRRAEYTGTTNMDHVLNGT